ncbi:hypothetical protein GRB70_37455 [Bradyrhizobium neotropicale]|nr:hypothetical protein [Bradyrhizobium neotropicale]
MTPTEEILKIVHSMRESLKPCPFCGATPHRGPTKTRHDQLHGEPFQNYRIWCPHGCASIERPSKELAISAWNTRTSPPLPGDDPVATTVRGPSPMATARLMMSAERLHPLFDQ